MKRISPSVSSAMSIIRQSSSAVEETARRPKVGGSNPRRVTMFLYWFLAWPAEREPNVRGTRQDQSWPKARAGEGRRWGAAAALRPARRPGSSQLELVSNQRQQLPSEGAQVGPRSTARA